MSSKNLHQLFEQYITSCQYGKQLRPQTLKSYRDVYQTFKRVMPEIQTLDDLHPIVITEFFKRISTRERKVGNKMMKTGVKTSTIKTYYNKLIAFFRWLEHLNHIEKGALTDKIPKPPNPTYQDDKTLTSEQVSRIISSIALNCSDDIFGYKRDLLIINLFIYTGIRKRELLSLRIKDIDFESKTIFINGKTSKSKKNRTIPLHPTLIHVLKSYLKELKKKRSYSSSLIVSTRTLKPFTQHGLKHWVERYKSLSGVRFHVHQTRHTFACALAQQNASISSIMKVLGHSSIRTTEIYLRSINTEDSRDYIDKLSF